MGPTFPKQTCAEVMGLFLARHETLVLTGMLKVFKVGTRELKDSFFLDPHIDACHAWCNIKEERHSAGMKERTCY